jgi:soluble lytic murein transglycosylase-like protein
MTGAVLAAVLLLQEPDIGRVADLAEARAGELGRNRVSPTQAGDIASAAMEASRRFQVPVAVILAMIETESAYGVSERSSARCRGLMQLNPSQGRKFAAMIGARRFRPLVIRDNVLMGAAYLRQLWDLYGRLDHGLSAYNKGPGMFERQHRPVGRYAKSVLRRLPMLVGRLTAEPLSAMVVE